MASTCVGARHYRGQVAGGRRIHPQAVFPRLLQNASQFEHLLSFGGQARQGPGQTVVGRVVGARLGQRPRAGRQMGHHLDVLGLGVARVRHVDAIQHLAAGILRAGRLRR